MVNIYNYSSSGREPTIDGPPIEQQGQLPPPITDNPDLEILSFNDGAGGFELSVRNNGPLLRAVRFVLETRLYNFIPALQTPQEYTWTMFYNAGFFYHQFTDAYKGFQGMATNEVLTFTGRQVPKPDDSDQLKVRLFGDINPDSNYT